MGHAYGRARGFGIIRAGSTDLPQEQDPQRRGHRHHRRCDRSLGDGDCGNIIVTPFYAHMTTAQVVALIVPALLPFNALKFTIHGVVTFLIYKPISNLLNR